MEHTDLDVLERAPARRFRIAPGTLERLIALRAELLAAGFPLPSLQEASTGAPPELDASSSTAEDSGIGGGGA